MGLSKKAKKSTPIYAIIIKLDYDNNIDVFFEKEYNEKVIYY